MTDTTENYYRNRIRNYKPNHSTFGGKIYNYDFDGYTSMNDIAKRIVSDWKFDEQCRKNIENINRQKNNQKGIN